MTNDSPTVTVVTVVYNAVHEIKNTIQSVLSQHYNSMEYIIIDGKSNDGTLMIINEHDKSISSIISEPDQGIFDAMNKALKIAKGEWIIFMNAGDFFVDDSVLISVFDKNFDANIGVLYGDVYLNEISQEKLSKWTPFFESKKKIKNMGISHQAMFVRTKLAKQYGFNLSYKIVADYDMIYNIYKNRHEFYYLKCPISVYDTNGFSAKNRKLQLIETAKIYGFENTLDLKIRLYILSIRLFIKNSLNNS